MKIIGLVVNNKKIDEKKMEYQMLKSLLKNMFDLVIIGVSLPFIFFLIFLILSFPSIFFNLNFNEQLVVKIISILIILGLILVGNNDSLYRKR